MLNALSVHFRTIHIRPVLLPLSAHTEVYVCVCVYACALCMLYVLWNECVSITTKYDERKLFFSPSSFHSFIPNFFLLFFFFWLILWVKVLHTSNFGQVFFAHYFVCGCFVHRQWFWQQWWMDGWCGWWQRRWPIFGDDKRNKRNALLKCGGKNKTKLSCCHIEFDGNLSSLIKRSQMYENCAGGIEDEGIFSLLCYIVRLWVGVCVCVCLWKSLNKSILSAWGMYFSHNWNWFIGK